MIIFSPIENGKQQELLPGHGGHGQRHESDLQAQSIAAIRQAGCILTSITNSFAPVQDEEPKVSLADGGNNFGAASYGCQWVQFNLGNDWKKVAILLDSP